MAIATSYYSYQLLQLLAIIATSYYSYQLLQLLAIIATSYYSYQLQVIAMAIAKLLITWLLAMAISYSYYIQLWLLAVANSQLLPMATYQLWLLAIVFYTNQKFDVRHSPKKLFSRSVNKQFKQLNSDSGLWLIQTQPSIK